MRTIVSIFFLTVSISHAQQIPGGFDKDEYREMMLISTRTTAVESYYSAFPEPANYGMIYRSPEIGLANLWDLWIDSSNQTAVISIRGTTEHPDSWLLNFYAAMVPAKGNVTWATGTFDYAFSENPQAAVHVGWLVGTAMLYADIKSKLDSLSSTGVLNYYIVGHSQGGAIAYLLTAHLLSQQKTGFLPGSLSFKTYCSAAPKPGNLFFAYAYENMTYNRAFNVVNTADWVPEVPMSIQTLSDFNPVNPFKHAKKMIKKQPLKTRLALKHIYKKLDKPTRIAQKKYEKYLGDLTTKMVLEKIPGLRVPQFLPTNDYVRTGTTIILTPDESYYEKYDQNPTNVFVNHFHQPYLDLLEKF